MRILLLTVMMGLFIPLFSMQQQVGQPVPVAVAAVNGHQLLQGRMVYYTRALKRSESRERLTNWFGSIGLGTYAGWKSYAGLNQWLMNLSILNKYKDMRVVPILSGVGGFFAGMAALGISLPVIHYLGRMTRKIYCLPCWDINAELRRQKGILKEGVTNDHISVQDIDAVTGELASDPQELLPANEYVHNRKKNLLDHLKEFASQHLCQKPSQPVNQPANRQS